MDNKTSQLEEFRQALYENASFYGVDINEELIARLADYYQLLNIWNPRLHLVAPCSPNEFATRHILESLLLLHRFPEDARVVDVGSGAGLPIIPCLIVRPDLHAVLIESSPRKAVFLREALRLNENSGSAEVVAQRFQDVSTPAADFITSRALDRFVEILPALIGWSPRPSKLLLFGGENLKGTLESLKQESAEHPIPRSDKRFLFVVERK
jgi:16S rRNA (guanine(527)-N(7))-methyltransferase RsmG